MAGASGSRGGYGWPFAENKGDGRLGWLGGEIRRDHEGNQKSGGGDGTNLLDLSV